MAPPDRATRFVDTLLPAFEQAAAIADALQGRVANTPKSSERSEVKAALTIADTAAQEAILVPLIDGFVDCCLEAEEDTPSVGRFRESDPHNRIVIDPIDGTFRFYLGGAGPYAMMAGWAYDGIYHAALVALPTERVLLVATRGGGARVAPLPIPEGALTTRAVAVDAASTDASAVLVSDTVPPALHEALHAAGFAPRMAAGGAISVAPLLPGVAAGLRLAGDPSGLGISTRGRVGALVAREAGAHLETANGEPFPESIDVPAASMIVARDPAVAAALRQAMASG